MVARMDGYQFSIEVLVCGRHVSYKWRLIIMLFPVFSYKVQI